MGQIDWDILAIACQANHDLYSAAYEGDEKLAKDAVLRGADPEKVAAWVEDEGARDFLLNNIVVKQSPLAAGRF